MHSLVCMDCQSDCPASHVKGSSRINWAEDPMPYVLHACRDSRTEALKVFVPLAVSSSTLRGKTPIRWVNTMYSKFYMGGHRAEKFKISIDAVIKLNTTRPFPSALRLEFEGLQTIRLLTVDLNIVAATSVKV
jgi:hypothetical protein